MDRLSFGGAEELGIEVGFAWLCEGFLFRNWQGVWD